MKWAFPLLIALPLTALGQQVYSVDTTWFKNPERGLFVFANSHRLPTDLTGHGNWINIGNMPDSVTLVYEEFVLHDFKTTPISQAYLDSMQSEFNNVRARGMKSIVRFCYVTSSDWDEDPPDITGATISMMLTHVQQIQPVIRNNIDVIANFQAGFIGRWGEWGGGEGSVGFAYPDYSRDSVAQASLLQSLLSMVPGSRMIDVRTPRYKLWYLHDLVPLSLADWWSGSAKGRIGEHNDAFHASQDDRGTFWDYNILDTSYFRPWYKAETKFGGIVAEQDGEWSSLYDPSWFANLNGWYLSFVQPMGRENAEMANQHVMTIQLLPDEAWAMGMKSRGLWNTVLRRLGYRLQFINSQLPSSAAPGGPIRLRFRLTNTGWSSPRNPRGLELVLRGDASGVETRINLFQHKHPQLDPRLWWAGDTVQVDTTVVLPGSLAPGTYSAFVNLPDTCASIKGRPEYSIRLANQGVWEPRTGYNNFGTKIVVAANVHASPLILLQGPFSSGTGLMSNSLRTSGILATKFPGAAIPGLAVDSISVEIRNATTAGSSTILLSTPAWLLTDGTVRGFADTTKSYLTFPTSPGSFYIVIRHRNHLAIMSKNPVSLNSTTPTYDFTTAQTQAYGSPNAMILVGTRYCMISGDADGNGQVQNSDVNTGIRPNLGLSGCLNADANLDGQVQNTDVNFYTRPNLGHGTQVP